MVNMCFLATTQADCPTITVTYGGEDEGFQLKSSWGSIWDTMVLHEAKWGRIVTYYELLPRSDPQARAIPEDINVVNLDESPPLVPKGSKLLRFPANEDLEDFHQLWTLYFPPHPPTSADRFETRDDLATKPLEPRDVKLLADLNRDSDGRYGKGGAGNLVAGHGGLASDEESSDEGGSDEGGSDGGASDEGLGRVETGCECGGGQGHGVEANDTEGSTSSTMMADESSESGTIKEDNDMED